MRGLLVIVAAALWFGGGVSVASAADGISSLATQVAAPLQSAATPQQPSAQTATEAVGSTTQAVASATAPVAATATSAVEQGSATVAPVVAPVESTVGGGVSAATDIVAPAVTTVTSAVQPVTAPIVEQLDSTVSSTVEPVTEAVSQAAEPVARVVGVVTQTVSPATGLPIADSGVPRGSAAEPTPTQSQGPATTPATVGAPTEPAAASGVATHKSVSAHESKTDPVRAITPPVTVQCKASGCGVEGRAATEIGSIGLDRVAPTARPAEAGGSAAVGRPEPLPGRGLLVGMSSSAASASSSTSPIFLAALAAMILLATPRLCRRLRLSPASWPLPHAPLSFERPG